MRIPRIEHVETEESQPLARRFHDQATAEAYILGLEDAKRTLSAERMFPQMRAWSALNSLWIETKANHNLQIIDPPDLEYSKRKDADALHRD